MEIFGQKRLLSVLDSFTVNTLPHTIMFVGKQGCGKHLFTKYLAEKFNFNIEEITQETTADQFIEYRQSSINTIYLINISNYTEKQQNQILKFIEEPTAFSYNILLANSEIGILPTIKNRCIIYHFDTYTKEELVNYGKFLGITDDIVYDICDTPGKLSSITDSVIQNAISLCNIIIDNIQKASYANTLSLISKINLKDDYDKLDIDLFFNALLFVAKSRYVNDLNEIAGKVYLYTATYIQKLYNSKESFVLNYFSGLWQEINKC